MKKRMIAAAVLTAIAVQSVPLTGSAETVGVYEAEDAVMTGNMKAIVRSPDFPVERLPETLLRTRIRLNLQ